jgi:hypothetical protein
MKNLDVLFDLIGVAEQIRGLLHHQGNRLDDKFNRQIRQRQIDNLLLAFAKEPPEPWLTTPLGHVAGELPSDLTAYAQSAIEVAVRLRRKNTTIDIDHSDSTLAKWMIGIAQRNATPSQIQLLGELDKMQSKLSKGLEGLSKGIDLYATSFASVTAYVARQLLIIANPRLETETPGQHETRIREIATRLAGEDPDRQWWHIAFQALRASGMEDFLDQQERGKPGYQDDIVSQGRVVQTVEIARADLTNLLESEIEIPDPKDGWQALANVAKALSQFITGRSTSIEVPAAVEQYQKTVDNLYLEYSLGIEIER